MSYIWSSLEAECLKATIAVPFNLSRPRMPHMPQLTPCRTSYGDNISGGRRLKNTPLKLIVDYQVCTEAHLSVLIGVKTLMKSVNPLKMTLCGWGSWGIILTGFTTFTKAFTVFKHHWTCYSLLPNSTRVSLINFSWVWDQKYHDHSVFLHWSQLVGWHFQYKSAGKQLILANFTTRCQTFSVLRGKVTKLSFNFQIFF